MSSSLPDGFRIRGVAEADVDVVAAIVRAEEERVRGHSDWGPAEMSDFWRHADLDGGTWIVETTGGVPAAFAASMYRGDGTDCWAVAHPDFWGRGISAALLARVEDRAREKGAAVLKAGMLAENAAALALFERLGFHEARHFYQMRIDFDRPPEPPSWPEGILPSTFQSEDARAFHTALGDAFAEEWGFHALPFEEWKRTRLEGPDTDTSLWFVARDGDELAGVARCDPKRYGGGWIGALGVRKPWRKRGLGLALLRHAFVEFHRRGESHVGLGVDAENPTGATRLYEKAGMRVVTEDIVFQKALA
jgi:ribosomal protein S18 acetylase RimI-like enzyme